MYLINLFENILRHVHLFETCSKEEGLVHEQIMYIFDYNDHDVNQGVYNLQQFIYKDNTPSTVRLYFLDNKGEYHFIPFKV